MMSPKHEHENDDQFAPNFDMTCKTMQPVFVPNLKSFEPMQIDLWAKEVGVMLYGKMGCGHSFAHQHGCCNINVDRLSEL